MKRRHFLPSLFSFRNHIAIVLAIGIIQIALYWVVGKVASTDGTTPIPQPDTLLYCQAARRIVEGAPFSYSAGSAVCTGTTSVLHPFLLAILYAVGLTEYTLITAGFFLNSIFYLVFISSWAYAFRKWGSKTRVGLLASVLLALFGQTACSALSQSDIGLWLAASGLMAAGLASGRFAFYAPVFAMLPWVRPEGMVLVLAFSFVILFQKFFKIGKCVRNRDLVLAGVGLFSLMGVFFLNASLTGNCQFSSVAHKGYFANMPFFSAVCRTLADLVQIGKTYFFGFSLSTPRDYLFLPIWSGILTGIGVFSIKGSRTDLTGLAIMSIGSLGGCLTVAQSGWQNTNLDRYLAWVVPIAIFLMAEGACILSKLRNRGTCRWIPAFSLVLFSGIGFVASICMFGRNCRHMEPLRLFMEACERTMEPGASVGGHTGVGFAYGFSDRRFAHLAGIYSPEFHHAEEYAVLEDLKNNPEKRFDYWLVNLNEEYLGHQKSRDEVLGKEVLAGPFGDVLRRPDWQVFDRAVKLSNAPTGKVLRAYLDVGYPEHEKSFSYRVFDRYSRYPFDPFWKVDRLSEEDGKRIVEAGRLITGWDEMTIPTIPGKDLLVYMRTLDEITVSKTDGLFPETITGAFVNPIELQMFVDGTPVSKVEVKGLKKGFSDVSFVIPGDRIKGGSTEISFSGDHISCGYWFYQ